MILETEMNLLIFNKIEPFEKLNRNLDDLRANLENLEKLHTNFIQFNESVSSLIYGLNINAWCTEFQEAPSMESFSQKMKEDQIDMKIAQLSYKIGVLENNESKIPIRSVSHISSIPEVSDISLLTEESFLVDPKKTGAAATTYAVGNKIAASSGLVEETNNNNAAVKNNNIFKKPMPALGSSRTRNRNGKQKTTGASLTAAVRRQSRIPTLKKRGSVLPKK